MMEGGDGGDGGAEEDAKQVWTKLLGFADGGFWFYNEDLLKPLKCEDSYIYIIKYNLYDTTF